MKIENIKVYLQVKFAQNQSFNMLTDRVDYVLCSKQIPVLGNGILLWNFLCRSLLSTASVTLLTGRMRYTGWCGWSSWAALWPTSPSSYSPPTWTGTRTPAPAPSTGSHLRSSTFPPSLCARIGPLTSWPYRPCTTCKIYIQTVYNM